MGLQEICLSRIQTEDSDRANLDSSKWELFRANLVRPPHSLSNSLSGKGLA
jgi:hypothetical protein